VAYRRYYGGGVSIVILYLARYEEISITVSYLGGVTIHSSTSAVLRQTADDAGEKAAILTASSKW